MTLHTVTANAYRPSEALSAVRAECRRRGIVASKFTVDRADTGPRLDDAQVAVVVLRDSMGMVVPAARRLTYRVSFQTDGPTR